MKTEEDVLNPSKWVKIVYTAHSFGAVTMNAEKILSAKYIMRMPLVEGIVADGEWNNPATWDAGGVPVGAANVVIRHTVSLTDGSNGNVPVNVTANSVQFDQDLSNGGAGGLLGIRPYLANVTTTGKLTVTSGLSARWLC